MRWNIPRIAAALVTTSLLLCGQSYAQERLIENYNEPKHIMFMTTFGGSSHVSWVLSILDELSKRGHKITYVTREFQAKHAKPYPHFNTVILDGTPTHMEKAFALKHTAILDAAGDLLHSGYKDLQTDYPALLNMIQTQNVSVVLCGFATAPGCYEAAKDSNIPYIITASYAAFPDASAAYINNHLLTMKNPTTLGLSFIQRFYDMFVVPITGYIRMKPVGDWVNKMRHLSGCNVTNHEYEPWTHMNNLKLVNSLFGIEAARPLGPLIEMVGPIMQRQYNPLTPDLKEYLDAHSRVLYIAFGQHAVANVKDLEYILTGIMESIENGTYGGFLWASRKGAEAFPKEIKTKSGKIYSVQDMFRGHYSNLRFATWVPQTAVVMHPSVNVFLTHGGAGSMYEGLYAGKRFIVFPFYGDQFLNAQNVKSKGLGEYLNPEISQEEANRMIDAVGQDSDGKFQSNVNRYKALVQIHSKNGPLRGADLVEEVLFVNSNSYLPHRYEDARQMSFIKSHNLDLIAAALSIISASVYVSITVTKKMVKRFLTRIWAKHLPDDTKTFKLKAT
ncbi:hypothetical protein G6F43_005272 [Rhizopus delemar]|nr:hypothetical protein G6F43_005272 [Rhizopus delemar]